MLCDTIVDAVRQVVFYRILAFKHSPVRVLPVDDYRKILFVNILAPHAPIASR